MAEYNFGPWRLSKEFLPFAFSSERMKVRSPRRAHGRNPVANDERSDSMKMRAAVVRQKGGPFHMEDVELDGPREDEVLVRIAGAGLCHTDLSGRDQRFPTPLPVVLGHEGAGVVERVGRAVRSVSPGDHVVLSYLSCGTCPLCRRGRATLCLKTWDYNFAGLRPDGSTTVQKNGEAIHGSFFSQSSFATYALANEENTVKVTKDVPIEILGPLGCGVQTGAASVINSLRPRAGSSLAVFGTGGVGMSAVMAAAVCGCATIIAVDVNESRLKLARELGATHTINTTSTDPVERIRQITAIGVEYILDTTGIPAVVRRAVESLAPGGRCGMVAVSQDGTDLALDTGTMLQGREVFGIIQGDAVPHLFIPRLIELYKQGRFPFDRMIRFYRLDEINQAAEDSEKGVTLKAVLRP
jgi:aryl-alcohol dehydrogenase